MSIKAVRAYLNFPIESQRQNAVILAKITQKYILKRFLQGLVFEMLFFIFCHLQYFECYSKSVLYGGHSISLANSQV